ncbi:hypothetical protein K488DRAFT_92213 [Vararia minispora EC-137]|uniref:Uncharacterized protein n=1 Tax=Vararia minispora EC-137 TaxID=1314806 RepID=A0ACB8Q4L9_9AGAM|nr:hypothetical protein K488DRAFT_92213 [Vararia minispora EC-137]
MLASSPGYPSSGPVNSAAPSVDRSNSLASAASGQSTSSLTRRPRARTRPRALTLNAPRQRDKAMLSATPSVPMLTAAEMLDATSTPMFSLDASTASVPVPDRPPRSPLRKSSSPLATSLSGSAPLVSVVATDDVELESRRRSARRRRRKRGSSVPRDAYRLSFLSSASSPTSPLFPNQHHMPMQTFPNFPSLRETRQRLRDSYFTSFSGFSGTDTSLYPLSTSTGSGTDSPPSPRSLVESANDITVRHVNPDDGDDSSFDPDDVSYRLHLLLNNSYFLPPAHSKPSPAQLTPVSVGPKKAQPKSFFEIFRPRSKSKPESPVTPVTPQDPLPALRTTSDASTGERQSGVPKQSFALPSSVPGVRSQVARVAVVRETLDNLAAAAKQAEREIKVLENQEEDRKSTYDDVIDPTDAVDLPPPFTNSLFDVQTSTLAGLGVEQSVGAAELADRLPPGTPGIWSIDPDDSWRKALLQEAVSMSLNSTPAPSHRLRHPSDASNSTHRTPGNQSGSSRFDRRILMPERLEDVVETDVQIPVPTQRPKLRTRASAPETRAQGMPQLAVPLPSHPPRAESPHTPHTPLLPPPRKGGSTQATRSELSESQSFCSPSHAPATSARGVRKTSSSPQMHKQYELMQSMGPPRSLSPVAEPATGQHILKTSLDTSESDSVLEGRHSFARSLTASIASASSTASSISCLHPPSPTRSAFQDARASFATWPAGEDASEGASEAVITDMASYVPAAASARFVGIHQSDTSTPPPRTSSSLAHTPLRPPPRSSSFNVRAVSSSLKHEREPSPRPSISSSDPGHSPFVSANDLRAPSPCRPSTSRSDQSRSPYLFRASMSSQRSTSSRHRRGGADATLQVPGALLARALHDAPASPIEFFDQVEAASRVDAFQTAWEDDEDGVVSSSTDDYGTVWATPAHHTPSPQQSPRLSPHASPRMAMKSLPTAVSSAESLPLSRRSPVQPVGHTPTRPAYFKDTHSPQVLGPMRTRPATAPSTQTQDDMSIYSAESASSAASAGRVGRTPSMLRLDGMLLQHMETEREAFRRIAKANKTASVRSAAT